MIIDYNIEKVIYKLLNTTFIPYIEYSIDL